MGSATRLNETKFKTITWVSSSNQRRNNSIKTKWQKNCLNLSFFVKLFHVDIEFKKFELCNICKTTYFNLNLNSQQPLDLNPLLCFDIKLFSRLKRLKFLPGKGLNSCKPFLLVGLFH